MKWSVQLALAACLLMVVHIITWCCTEYTCRCVYAWLRSD